MGILNEGTFCECEFASLNLDPVLFTTMLASEPILDSSSPSTYVGTPEIPALATFDQYTMYPMEYCSEDQVAKLFSRVCQRGNPVLQGRPEADLILLGRAMYRKANKMRLGQVAIHNGEPVALGCCWDVADGGVWKGSGLEMPASLAAHAAAGKAAFESLKTRSDKTFFCAFYGVLPPHNVALFGYLAISGFMMAHAMGFQDTFQYTLLPTLIGRGVFAKHGKDTSENMDWTMRFADVPTDNAAVSAELKELNGNINLSLTNMNYVMGEDYMTKAAGTVRLKTADEIRRPAQLMATNHLNWLKQTQPTNRIASRL